MAKHPKTITLDNFSGINNVALPERTDPKYLKEADNVDITKDGAIIKRPGYTLKIAGDYHSLFESSIGTFVVSNGAIYIIHNDYSTTQIVSGLANTDFKWVEVNQTVYYTNSQSTGEITRSGGVYTHNSWGIASPASSPSLSEGFGSLHEGVYQVAIGYVTNNGDESGLSAINTITLSTDNKGIVLNNIPTSSDPRVTKVRIYCSTQNGEGLYYLKDITNGTAATTINNLYGMVTPNNTFNKIPVKAGTDIFYYEGRIYIEDGNVLWYTNKYDYGYYNPAKNFFILPSDIRECMPVDDGIWVGMDSLYFMAGKEPEKMYLIEKEPIKVVKDSGVRIPGAYIFIENTPLGYKWLFTSDKGIFVAFSSGVVLNTTERNVGFPEAEEGSATFIQMDGINKYISLLKNANGTNQNMAVGDLVTAEIVRNGIVI